MEGTRIPRPGSSDDFRELARSVPRPFALTQVWQRPRFFLLSEVRALWDHDGNDVVPMRLSGEGTCPKCLWMEGRVGFGSAPVENNVPPQRRRTVFTGDLTDWSGSCQRATSGPETDTFMMPGLLTIRRGTVRGRRRPMRRQVEDRALRPSLMLGPLCLQRWITSELLSRAPCNAPSGRLGPPCHGMSQLRTIVSPFPV